MQQVKGFFFALIIGFGLTLASSAHSAEADDGEADYCELLLEFFGADEMHHRLTQRNLPVPKSLSARREELRKMVFVSSPSRPIGKPAATRSDDDALSFEAYREWTPDDEGDESEWSPEREREGEKPNPVEGQHFSWEKQLNQLEEYLSHHEPGDAEARADAVFRRFLVNGFFASGRFKNTLERLGVMEPTQQVLTLELWAHNLTRTNTTEPAPEALALFAAVVNSPSDEVLNTLSLLNLNSQTVSPHAQIRTLHEVIDSLAAGRAGTTPDQLLIELQKFRRGENHPYPTETFGKLLVYYFSGDELTQIQNAKSLGDFLSTHPN